MGFHKSPSRLHRLHLHHYGTRLVPPTSQITLQPPPPSPSPQVSDPWRLPDHLSRGSDTRAGRTLIEHPSDTFLAELEEDSVKLILQHDKTVVASCLACLGSIVNRVTKNFGLIRDCFRKYYGEWYV